MFYLIDEYMYVCHPHGEVSCGLNNKVESRTTTVQCGNIKCEKINVHMSYPNYSVGTGKPS